MDPDGLGNGAGGDVDPEGNGRGSCLFDDRVTVHAAAGGTQGVEILVRRPFGRPGGDRGAVFNLLMPADPCGRLELGKWQLVWPRTSAAGT